MNERDETIAEESSASQEVPRSIRTVTVVRVSIQCVLVILAGVCLPTFFFLGREHLESGVMHGGPGIGGIGVLYFAAIALLPGVVGFLAAVAAFVLSLVCDHSWNWLRISSMLMFATWFLSIFGAACFVLGSMR